VPYQLHCDAPHEETLLELGAELFELDDGTLLGADELTTELFELEDVVAVELEVTVEQTEPVTVGVSAGTPLVSP
jgi:hypothetical protein